jgi:hypothetical protein
MKLVTIGDRTINLETMTAATWMPQTTVESGTIRQRRIIISFGCDDTEIFYEAEADALWACLQIQAMRLFIKGAEQPEEAA